MTIQKILIAVDDSKYAEHAAEFGFDMARVYKAEVGLVSIVEPIMLPCCGKRLHNRAFIGRTAIDEQKW